MLPMFEKCIAGLMHVDVYFSASETQPVCHFNQFRSRQKYQEFCNRLLGRVWEELNARNLQEFEWRYLEIQLEEMGKLFVLEDGKVVVHRNVLVFRDKSAVDLGKRAEPHGFLMKLSDDYQRYWEEREG